MAPHLTLLFQRRKAKLGEKTFLDGFDPGVQALKVAVEAGEDLAAATAKAAVAAEEGFNAATNMKAVHGKPAVNGLRNTSIKLMDVGVSLTTTCGYHV